MQPLKTDRPSKIKGLYFHRVLFSNAARKAYPVGHTKSVEAYRLPTLCMGYFDKFLHCQFTHIRFTEKRSQ